MTEVPSRPRAITDPGSFRDPAGSVFHWQRRVYRAITGDAAAQLERTLSSPRLQDWIASSRVVATRRVDLSHFPAAVLASLPLQPSLVVEHAPIPHISYPYEWPFALLKRAALHHLDLQLDGLAAGLTFSDASAYNIQFQGVRPIFIDVLALRPYRDGEYWNGYHQFCTQFLNPLLLSAKLGLPYGPWYRGALEGIPVVATARLLPKRHALSWKLLVHVFVHAWLMERAGRVPDDRGRERVSRRKLGKPALTALLTGLRSYIASLRPRNREATAWGDYERSNSYRPGETAAKAQFVREYVASSRPSLVWDIGCNTGYYSEQALIAGARDVIGFDTDLGALEAAVTRADAKALRFTPLFLDAANPSPDQGWQQAERKGLSGRSTPEGVLGLALLHHLVIGRNIPMPQAISWLIQTAPSGVLEFVPKGDPLVDRMMSRKDLAFEDYTVERLRLEVSKSATIARECVITQSGRTLLEFRRGA